MTYSDIQHDPDRHLFTMQVDGERALISYIERDGVLQLVHSEVPMHMRGLGVGRILVLKTFDYILKHGLRARAVCSYIRAVATRDPMWSDIIEV